MNTFTSIFLGALALSLLVQLWLIFRQSSHVSAHRAAVPNAFKDTVTLDDHQKAADYTIEKNRIGLIDLAISSVFLLAMTLGGGIDAIANVWGSWDLAAITTGIGIILSVFFIGYLIDIPLSWYQTFNLEQRFGFNRTTVRQYLIDQLMQLGLGLVIGVPLLALILWVIESVGSLWWILAWAILVGFSLLMSWAYPTLIAPLFNKFDPLKNATLQQRIDDLLERCGFNSNGIFVMDGSRRSGHGNAYFTGMGKSKRIVFFDTLLDSLNGDEIEAVLAHELGHFKHKHVTKMLISSSLMSFAGFAILGWISNQSWFYQGLGVNHESYAIALLLFMMVSPAFTFFLQPISAFFQRKFEFQADDYAASVTRASALIDALVKLYKENANTLTPDPLYSAFHYSHPPAAIRIANLETRKQS
jgi:STE24 endopeptidase